MQTLIANMGQSVLVPLVQCIPTGGGQLGPFARLMTTLTSSLGDLLIPATVLMAVLLGLVALLTILSPKAREYIRSLLFVFVIPLAVVFMIMLFLLLWNIFNNAC